MDGSSWRLVIRLGISHGTHEALTFLAARVAGDGGDARKALQVGPKIGWNRESEGFLGRVGSVFWYVYCICVLFYFIYDMIYDIYIYMYIFVYIYYIYILIYLLQIYITPELFVIQNCLLSPFDWGSGHAKKLWLVFIVSKWETRFDQTCQRSLAATKQSTWFVRWLTVKAYQQIMLEVGLETYPRLNIELTELT